MLASCLLQNGPQHLTLILRDTENWLHSHKYASLNDMRGTLSKKLVENAGVLERINYLRTLENSH